MAILDLIREMFKLHAEVYSNDTDGGRKVQGHGGKIEDSEHATGHDLIGDALGGLGGYGQDRETDVLVGNDFGEIIERVDQHVIEAESDFGRVVVEEGGNVESAVAEASVLEQSSAEIPQPDQGHRPISINSENASESSQKLLDPVADPRVAKLTKEREILADLGVVDPQGSANLAAGDRYVALVTERFKLTQV